MKIIKIFLAINLLISAVLLVKVFLPGKQKVVYVDTFKLLSNYKGMIDAEQEIAKKKTVFEANIDTLFQEFQNELKTFEKNRSKFSSKQLTEAQKSLQIKEQQIQQYKEANEGKFGDEERRIKEQVLKTINVYITEIAKKNSYEVVLGLNGSGNVLYGDTKNDITENLISDLNKAYKPVH